MANDWFRFKKFIIHQADSAMKVGTDGVILGAWCSVKQASHVLDIGTGTGIIALMAAQRSVAKIDALEIDKSAFIEAGRNVEESEFAQRIKVIHGDFLEFAKSSEIKYDSIICNPPYFDNSLQPSMPGRALARHSISLDLEILIRESVNLLSQEGYLSIIIPKIKEDQARQIAINCGLQPVRSLSVRGQADGIVKRVLLEWSRAQQRSEIMQDLSVFDKKKEYSRDFISLTKNFYLDF